MKPKDRKQAAATVKTITCQHCRYERPADDAYCHICGHPWRFAEKAGAPAPKRRAK